jgi:hypothetical protein
MNEVLIPLAGIALPIILVPSILALRHQQRRREMEHLERMKALEMGHMPPMGHAWSSLAIAAVGAGVPIAGFAFAWLANLGSRAQEGAWITAMFVGVAGIVGGVKLSKRLSAPLATDSAPPADVLANGKPVEDPDAYDVVGRRG